MKCYCCDKILSSREATRRFSESNSFVDMCDKCLATIEEDIDTIDGIFDGEDDEETPLE